MRIPFLTTVRLLYSATALLIAVSLIGGGAFAQDESTSEIARDPSSANIKVEAFLNLTRMDFNDTATMTLRLTWDEGKFKLKDRSAPKLDLVRLRVGSVTSRTRPFNEGSKKRISQEYIYTLIPTASGEGVVKPLRIGFLRESDSRPGTVSTSELRALILMPSIEAEKQGSDWRTIGAVLVALSVLAGILATLFMRKRRKQALENRQSQEQIQLATKLKELKAATSGTKAEFFDTLYEFLYGLLRDNGFVSARKGDSDSVIADLQRAAIPENIKRKLTNWLELSAIEKFSPGRGTPGETLRVYYEVEVAMRESFMHEGWPTANELGATLGRDSEKSGQD